MAGDKPVAQDIQAEVDRNFEAFGAMLPDLLKDYAGKYVLLRDTKLIQKFDTAGDALIYAQAQFPDGLYSIQEVTGRIIDLGFFSHAMPLSHIQPVDRASS